MLGMCGKVCWGVGKVRGEVCGGRCGKVCWGVGGVLMCGEVLGEVWKMC